MRSEDEGPIDGNIYPMTADVRQLIMAGLEHDKVAPGQRQLKEEAWPHVSFEIDMVEFSKIRSHSAWHDWNSGVEEEIQNIKARGLSKPLLVRRHNLQLIRDWENRSRNLARWQAAKKMQFQHVPVIAVSRAWSGFESNGLANLENRGMSWNLENVRVELEKLHAQNRIRQKNLFRDLDIEPPFLL